MNLSGLASAIATRNCVLFAGSGLTANTGGCTWEDLVNYLKKEFNYDSILEDNFEIMTDLLREHRDEQERIHAAVKERLKNAYIAESLLPLTELPWYSVFTTNYDLALEKALNQSQQLLVRTITTGNEYQLDSLASELLVVKLMGSLDIPYGHQGAMILDSGDLEVAKEERGRIFDTLADHANNLSFVFIGYSFNDKIFLNILDFLAKKVGEPKNRYYAVFRSMPDPKNAYLLKRYNVELIVLDLDTFVYNLTHEVSLRNPDDLTKKRLFIENEIISLDTTRIGNFLTKFNPVFYEEIESPVKAQFFFKGNVESLKPFNLGWHFNRKQITELTNDIEVLKPHHEDKNPHIFAVLGNPGTGRTYTILAIINQLIREKRSIAIRIPDYAIQKIPSLEELEIFLGEVERKVKEFESKKPERIIFFSTSDQEISTILRFYSLSLRLLDYPTILIFEDSKSKESFWKTYANDKVSLLDVDDTLSDKEKIDLEKYILKIVKLHKFEPITIDEVRQIIREERQFLPIIYRCLDPSKRSIQKIVQEKLAEISKNNKIILDCVIFTSLTSSNKVPLPKSILRKALNKRYRKNWDFDQIDEFIDIANSLIVETRKTNNYAYLSIYHPIIANYITSLFEKTDMDRIMLDIADTVNLNTKEEADFIGQLLIANGVNNDIRSLRPFTVNGLVEAFKSIKKRQPARPILHHYARLLMKINKMDTSIIPLLEEAIQNSNDNFLLRERIENVYTTLAHVKWEQNKDRLAKKHLTDPSIQEIMELLHLAKSSTNPNIHPYDVHTRILKDLWHSKPEMEKFELVNEAIKIISEGLILSDEDPFTTERLHDLLIDCWNELDPEKAKNIAKQLLEENKDGTGYYTLAKIEAIKNHNDEAALEYLDISMTGDIFPPDALALKIELLFKLKTPPYKEMLLLADKLSNSRFVDSWKSAYHKAIIFAINGLYSPAIRFFEICGKQSPKSAYYLDRLLFVMENNQRKIFNGKISDPLYSRDGRIFSHNFEKWEKEIFFAPHVQKHREVLKTGLHVDFEIAFSPRGPMAFDVRPHKWK